MMTFSIDDYLRERKAEKIDIGVSGADVYDVDGEYILKHVKRTRLRNRELFSSYKKEAHFYRLVDREEFNCLPEVISITETDDEILLLMKNTGWYSTAMLTVQCCPGSWMRQPWSIITRHPVFSSRTDPARNFLPMSRSCIASTDGILF